MKGTGLGYDDVWGGNPFTSEERTEQELNKIVSSADNRKFYIMVCVDAPQGLRYSMNRTEKEAKGLAVSFGPISIPV